MDNPFSAVAQRLVLTWLTRTDVYFIVSNRRREQEQRKETA